MDEAKQLQIRTYLLHRMEDEERVSARGGRKTEAELLAGDFIPASISKLARKYTLFCLLNGVVIGISFGQLAAIVP